jgi:sulfite reductase (ferredoxin)
MADPRRAELHAYVGEVARHFRPRTNAYYQLWLDGEHAVTAVAPDEEPLYSRTYLPRKFKIGFAYPGDNCIDVYTHDIGIVPVLTADTLGGFTLLVGGGMGRSHTNPDTFPGWPTPSPRSPPVSCSRYWRRSSASNEPTATATTASTPA